MIARVVRYLQSQEAGTEVTVSQIADRLGIAPVFALSELDAAVKAGDIVRRVRHSHARAPGLYSLAKVTA